MRYEFRNGWRDGDPFLPDLSCRLRTAIPRSNIPPGSIQAPCKPASHEPKANEANFCRELIEFCYWHVNDVISSSSRWSFRPWSVIDPGYMGPDRL
jgi:hypothetical protein